MFQATLTLETGDTLEVHRFTVDEEISAPFVASVLAHGADAGVDLRRAVGRGASLLVEADGGPPATWAGIVREMQQLEAEEAGLSTYVVEIVPRVWLLTQRVRSRVFQHLSAIDVALAVLAEWGVEAELRLDRAAHPRLEVRTQYEESDFAFLSRMLEEAGVSFLVPRAAGHRLVLCAEPQASAPRPGALPYVERPAANQREEHVTSVRVRQRVAPGSVSLRGNDVRRGSAIGISKAGHGMSSPVELMDYRTAAFIAEGEGGGDETPVADRRGAARARQETGGAVAEAAALGEQAAWRTVELETNAWDLCPGAVFRVTSHPQIDALPGQDLLVRASRVSGGYRGLALCGIGAVPTAAPFRPAARTPRPRVEGLQSAIVVGAAGEEIHVDELGRIRVRFLWDPEAPGDDRSSAWIRVSQAFAGAGFGISAIPRVGEEVLVDFAGGDPDEPFVVGRLHNGKARRPYDLPAQRARAGIRTRSSPGGDGYHEIALDDTKGEELIRWRAQRDQKKVVKRNEAEHTGGSRVIKVGGDLVIRAKGKVSLRSGADLVIEGGYVKLNCREEEA